MSQSFLQGLETELKDLWSQYLKCVDRDGEGDRARALREQYFRLYQTYKRNKSWKDALWSRKL